MFAIVIVFFTIVGTYLIARIKANDVMLGKDPRVDVRHRSFLGTAGQVTEPDLRLIGATQKAIFFYDVDDERTIVIPQAQIVSIEVPDVSIEVPDVSTEVTD